MTELMACIRHKKIRLLDQGAGPFEQALLYSLCGILLLVPGKTLSESEIRYQLSIGAMVFSDVSDSSENDYQEAGFSLPVTISVRRQAMRWSLGSSYLRQTQNDGTQQGIGDTRLGVSFDVNHWLTLGYKHKFATGSESRGFSTGEDDDKLYLDLYHPLSYSMSLFASTGYKWVGEGDRTDRRDAGHVAVGMGYRFDTDFNFLVSFDHYQSSYTTSSDINSITLMASHRMDKSVSLSWFVNGDSSDAYSAGTTINYSF
jgi:hypothetical protein